MRPKALLTTPDACMVRNVIETEYHDPDLTARAALFLRDAQCSGVKYRCPLCVEGQEHAFSDAWVRAWDASVCLVNGA